MSNRLSYVVAVIILLLAVLFRASNFLDFPQGISDAEMTTMRLTETVRQGQITVFLQDAQGNGRESLYPTTLAVSTALTVNGFAGYRIFSVWVNLIALAVVYTLGARLYGRVAGLLAMALLAVTMWHTLLSRLVLVETVIPLLVATVMLAIARALPVYRVARQESTTTLAFAGLGITLAIGLYIHPVGVLLALATMIFIVYSLWLRRSMLRQRLSYLGFALLILIIATIPYLITNINAPTLGASSRLFGQYEGIINSAFKGIGALFIQGDANVIYNLPNRPLFDPLTFIAMIAGLVVCVVGYRSARFMLTLMFLVILAPMALLTDTPPNFAGLTVWLVPLALLFGVGVTILTRFVATRWRWVWVGTIATLLVINALWTFQDLFITWRNRPDVARAYHADVHALARHLDRTLNELNTVICYNQWNETPDSVNLSNTQQMYLMMSRSIGRARIADCRTSLIFTGGGTYQQIVFPDPDPLAEMHPYLQEWVARGTWATTLPANRVLIIDFADTLANALGQYQSLSPANYSVEAPKAAQQIFPPVRFGGNITWLGNEMDTRPSYRAGDTVSIINFWRVEGVIPRDLTLFTHLLRDPVTIAQNRDTISVNPRRLQDRDVFIQVTEITLQPTILAGEYVVSIGAYQDETDARLPVFDGEQIRQGDRLILYPIRVE